MHLRLNIIDKIMPYIENRTFMSYGIMGHPLCGDDIVDELLELV